MNMYIRMAVAGLTGGALGGGIGYAGIKGKFGGYTADVPVHLMTHCTNGMVADLNAFYNNSLIGWKAQRSVSRFLGLGAYTGNETARKTQRAAFLLRLMTVMAKVGKLGSLEPNLSWNNGRRVAAFVVALDKVTADYSGNELIVAIEMISKLTDKVNAALDMLVGTETPEYYWSRNDSDVRFADNIHDLFVNEANLVLGTGLTVEDPCAADAIRSLIDTLKVNYKVGKDTLSEKLDSMTKDERSQVMVVFIDSLLQFFATKYNRDAFSGFLDKYMGWMDARKWFKGREKKAEEAYDATAKTDTQAAAEEAVAEAAQAAEPVAEASTAGDDASRGSLRPEEHAVTPAEEKFWLAEMAKGIMDGINAHCGEGRYDFTKCGLYGVPGNLSIFERPLSEDDYQRIYGKPSNSACEKLPPTPAVEPEPKESLRLAETTGNAQTDNAVQAEETNVTNAKEKMALELAPLVEKVLGRKIQHDPMIGALAIIVEELVLDAEPEDMIAGIDSLDYHDLIAQYKAKPEEEFNDSIALSDALIRLSKEAVHFLTDEEVKNVEKFHRLVELVKEARAGKDVSVDFMRRFRGFYAEIRKEAVEKIKNRERTHFEMIETATPDKLMKMFLELAYRTLEIKPADSTEEVSDEVAVFAGQVIQKMDKVELIRQYLMAHQIYAYGKGNRDFKPLSFWPHHEDLVYLEDQIAESVKIAEGIMLELHPKTQNPTKPVNRNPKPRPPAKPKHAKGAHKPSQPR